MKKLLALILLLSASIYADTPPQFINKQCSAHQFFSQIQPSAINCTQPIFADIGSVPIASASVSGILSNTDWSLFNSKQSALTLGNFTSPTTGVSVSGGTGAVIGAGVALSVQNATTSQPGLLTAADWNTFNSKQAAISLPLSLTNGGSAYNNNTSQVSTSGQINAFVPTTQITGFTSNSFKAINGIVADGTSRRVTIKNDTSNSSNLFVVSESTSATAANRIHIVGLNPSQISVGTNKTIDLVYDTNLSRWILAGSNSITTGALDESSVGYLSLTDWSRFNNKLSNNGGGSLGKVAVFSTASVLTGFSDLFFDSANSNLGIQNTSPATALDVSSVGAFSPNNPAGVSVSLLPATVPNANGVSGSQSTPHLNIPVSLSETQNNGPGSCIADDTLYTFSVWSVNTDGLASVVPVVNSQQDSNDSSIFQWEINWADGGSGLDTFDHYVVGVEANGTTLYQNVFGATTVSYACDGTFVDPQPNVFVDDYFSNGSVNLNFSAYTINTSPSGTTYYGDSPAVNSFSDPSSQTAFQLTVSVSSPSATTRVINNTTGQGIDTSMSVALGPNGWTGPTTISPNSYGILSNGTTLTQDFEVVGKDVVNTHDVYSNSPAIVSTVDPNDGLFYYSSLTYTVATAAAKVVNTPTGIPARASLEPSGAQTIAFDAFSTYPDTTIISPTQVFKNTATFHSNSSGSAVDPYNINLKSDLSDKTQIAFTDMNNTQTSYIQGTTSAMKINQASGELDLSVANNVLEKVVSDGVQLNGKLGFFSSAPVAQPIGDIISGLELLGLMQSVTVLGRVSALPANLNFSGNVSAITTNQMLGYGKVQAAISLVNLEAVATNFACTVNPVLTLYDCGLSAGACTTGRTNIASVTLTAANTGTDGVITTAALAPLHYWAVETSAGTCTGLTVLGNVGYQ